MTNPKPILLTIINVVLFSIFLLLGDKSAQADTACGIGSTCTGTNTYLRIESCSAANPNAPAPVNGSVNTYCYNNTPIPNYPHSCPTGGGPGSCVAFAPGKNGCSDVDPTYTPGGTGTNCTCSADGDSCTGHNTTCGSSAPYGTCSCNTFDEGVWSCGAPEGGPLGCCYTPATYCGDGTCNGGETCSTCTQDCGICGGPTPPPTPPPAFCGDGTCNAGETQQNCAIDCGNPGNPPPFCGDGACNALETCSTCSQDCGVCASPDVCGNGVCSATESCLTCSQDCGACGVGSCGDSICSAFETCNSCSADCGTCPTDVAWWQTRGGNLYAARAGSPAIRSLVPGDTCTEPGCIPQLLAQIEGLFNADTDGIIVTGGGNVQSDGYYTPRDLVALNTQLTRYKEGYDFFYRKSTLGLTPTDTFSGQSTDALKPILDGVFYTGGDMTIQQPWDVSSTESFVIFVNGDLTISNPSDEAYLTQVAEGGFLAFIVSGDIIFEPEVGNTDPGIATTAVEGIFIADGELRIESDGDLNTSDRRFVGAGSFIGWGGVDLQRDFTDSGMGSALNETIPVETFIYRPDLVMNTPAFMLSPHSIWQETN